MTDGGISTANYRVKAVDGTSASVATTVATAVLFSGTLTPPCSPPSETMTGANSLTVTVTVMVWLALSAVSVAVTEPRNRYYDRHRRGLVLAASVSGYCQGKQSLIRTRLAPRHRLVGGGAENKG
jgi:hypothetical protein